MTEYVDTEDGVRIAYDREGSGRPLILIGGAGQFRAVDQPTRTLTTELATRGFHVVHYDRPGRGDSGGEPPFTLAREVAALRALVAMLGGRASLYGSSSGGAIALAAAAEIPGIEHLVLWEVPLGEEEGSDGREFLSEITERVRSGDRESTLRRFMDGMPPEWFDGMRNGPDWPLFERMAPSVQADAEALAWTQSAPRRQLWAGVTAPTVVLVGTTAFPFFSDAADAIVASLPTAERAELTGSDHGWQPVDLAEAVAAHLDGGAERRQSVRLSGSCRRRRTAGERSAASVSAANSTPPHIATVRSPRAAAIGTMASWPRGTAAKDPSSS
ncbi:alpha/beta fold hydrolase [Pseudonocardia nigra]|uniref:alpha/beta fold hydrolase n=1 Tax=Pseudonocardia nigra TaxID=1921578 RepID=UPI001C5F04F8|nr:alpha/beta hydrolase [Pseudonocardia nigra]